ncbi:MAG TPA: hypothetical protein VMP03_15390 [Methylomirabilota bacterium]|nr:hypothetical protein [Methylomirabilota bacterium]
MELFVAMGCECRFVPEPIDTPDGERMTVRYLLNPENGRYVAIVDLEDGERLPPSEVRSWERRLMMRVPKGD